MTKINYKGMKKKKFKWNRPIEKRDQLLYFTVDVCFVPLLSITAAITNTIFITTVGWVLQLHRGWGDS